MWDPSCLTNTGITSNNNNPINLSENWLKLSTVDYASIFISELMAGKHSKQASLMEIIFMKMRDKLM